MPTSADLLLDTSAALAFLRPGEVGHAEVSDRVEGLTLGLAGHAVFETFSVITRLPGTLRLDAGFARYAMATNFPASRFLSADESARALDALGEARIEGGAVYDGLIGLAAASARTTLLSRDRRAARTYAALGVEYELV